MLDPVAHGMQETLLPRMGDRPERRPPFDIQEDEMKREYRAGLVAGLWVGGLLFSTAVTASMVIAERWGAAAINLGCVVVLLWIVVGAVYRDVLRRMR